MAKKASEDLTEGQKAPDFTLQDDKGNPVTLSKLRGKKVVLYFYPKDDTPGCTAEACAFRDGLDQLKDKNTAVFGVSADTVESHKSFREKYKLTFPLLSDPDKTVIQKYGVWKERSMYGRKFMGIERTTFVIDKNGLVQKIFPRVKVSGHFEEVLQNLS